MTNSPDFENITPEELEQFKKEYEWFQKASAERIAEIEKKAFERLRHPRRGSLRDYLES